MSDRDELAKLIHLSRNGGGTWVGAMDDDFDFIDAMNEADFVMASDWLARVKRETKAEALEAAANTFRGDTYTGHEVAGRLRERAAVYREQTD